MVSSIARPPLTQESFKSVRGFDALRGEACLFLVGHGMPARGLACMGLLHSFQRNAWLGVVWWPSNTDGPVVVMIVRMHCQGLNIALSGSMLTRFEHNDLQLESHGQCALAAQIYSS